MEKKPDFIHLGLERVASYSKNSYGFYTPYATPVFSTNTYSNNKAQRKESVEIKLISDDNFEDGSLLSYSDHELTEEQLRNITNHFAK